jgi:hypothetical protein
MTIKWLSWSSDSHVLISWPFRSTERANKMYKLFSCFYIWISNFALNRTLQASTSQNHFKWHGLMHLLWPSIFSNWREWSEVMHFIDYFSVFHLTILAFIRNRSINISIIINAAWFWNRNNGIRSESLRFALNSIVLARCSDFFLKRQFEFFLIRAACKIRFWNSAAQIRSDSLIFGPSWIMVSCSEHYFQVKKLRCLETELAVLLLLHWRCPYSEALTTSII